MIKRKASYKGNTRHTGKVMAGDPPKEVGTISVRSDATVTIEATEVLGPPQNPTSTRPVGTSTGPGIIVLAYRSPSTTCHWLLFFWEQRFFTKSGKRTVQSGKGLAPNGSYDLTTDKDSPKLHVDTWRNSSPYADEGGNSWDESEDGPELGLSDMPSNPIDDELIKAADGASLIEALIHFEAFLVCGKSILYEVDYVITFTWDGVKSQTTLSDVKGKAVSKLDDAHQAAIKSQFPDNDPANGLPK